MKKIFLSIFIATFLSSCVAVNDSLVTRSYTDGKCKKRDIKLEKISGPHSLSFVTRGITNFGGSEEELNSYTVKGLKEMEEAQLKFGGSYYELSTKKHAWKSLYGAWGYGVVKDNCLIYFHPIIVS